LLVAAMIAIALAIEAVGFGRLLLVSKLPLVALLGWAFAAVARREAPRR
jgi:uncharacterized membrane protein